MLIFFLIFIATVPFSHLKFPDTEQKLQYLIFTPKTNHSSKCLWSIKISEKKKKKNTLNSLGTEINPRNKGILPYLRWSKILE